MIRSIQYSIANATSRHQPTCGDRLESDDKLTQALQPLARAPEGVEVLAEREARVVLPYRDVFGAVKLQSVRNAHVSASPEPKIERIKCRERTSLTGMDDTPISFAMNHAALGWALRVSGRSGERKHGGSLEVSSSPFECRREGVVLWPEHSRYVLHDLIHP